jgi:hypothetical protein
MYCKAGMYGTVTHISGSLYCVPHFEIIIGVHTVHIPAAATPSPLFNVSERVLALLQYDESHSWLQKGLVFQKPSVKLLPGQVTEDVFNGRNRRPLSGIALVTSPGRIR